MKDNFSVKLEHHSFEQRKPMLKRLLHVAIDNALPFHEKEKDYRKAYSMDKIATASVHIDNLNDYQFVLLEAGVSAEQTKELVAHENAHTNKAEQLGLIFHGYRLVFQKDEEGFLVPMPAIVIDFPRDWSKERCDEVYKQVLRAPEEYGNILSEGDLQDLKDLES